VNAPGTGTPTGSVTFKNGATTLGSAALETVGGVATASLTTSQVPAGAHDITATYGGAPDFSGSAASLIERVVLYASRTTLASSANPAHVGQAVTFTARVYAAPGAGVPTGSVTFKNGATTLGTAALKTVGGVATATLTTTGVPAGAHDITATYGGATSLSGSAASLIERVVQYATRTALASSANPAHVGQAITLTARVYAAPAAGLPTGSVTFKNGATPLGTAVLKTIGGVATATLTTTEVPAGAHNITATYSGAAAFSGSAASLIERVS
jgi:microcystin-dependent protein